MQNATVELLPEHTKRNVRGNRIYSEERKRELVEDWRASGLTQKAFARKFGVKYGTLTSWTCKRRAVKKPTVAVAFEELSIRPVSKVATVASLEVALPDGTLVRGTQASEVANLVRELRRA